MQRVHDFAPERFLLRVLVTNFGRSFELYVIPRSGLVQLPQRFTCGPVSTSPSAVHFLEAAGPGPALGLTEWPGYV
jgi:hypothetical protein